jgi:glycine oxidase
MRICRLSLTPILNLLLAAFEMKAGIAGAGILGQLLAFALINAGWEVTLFDLTKRRNCSEVAAGLLTPVAELDKNELSIFKLGLEALQQHWPKILAHFNEKIYFQKKGSLVLAHPKDYADLARNIKIISSKLDNDDYYKYVGQQEISALEPHLGKFQQGYYFPAEGQLDSQALLKVLQHKLLTKGVNWIKNVFVQAVCPGKISLANNDYLFDLAFDCRGLGAKNQFNNLRSVRGELIWLYAPAVTITRPLRLIHPRYSLYLAPRPRHQYIVGASEIESSDLSSISLRTTLELLTAVYSINSNFSEARIIKTVTQCRPTLPDNLPRIKYSAGLIAINGLYRHGFLIAPSLVHDVLRWIEQGIAKVKYGELWEKTP